jgi:hypothetical protein
MINQTNHFSNSSRTLIERRTFNRHTGANSSNNSKAVAVNSQVGGLPHSTLIKSTCFLDYLQHPQQQQSQQQRSYPTKSNFSGSRPAAADFFDNNQQAQQQEASPVPGGFGRAHRTQAPPPREGRFPAEPPTNVVAGGGMARGGYNDQQVRENPSN